MECYKCEVSSSKALLFDVITPSGVEKVCRKCSFEEDSPIIRKAGLQKPIEPPQPVHKRLAKLAGIDKRREKINDELRKEDERINEVVNRNFRRHAGRSDTSNELIDHFHWIVMRARRSKHLTQKQVAESLKESEISIRMLERGIVPNPGLIDKVEEFFSLRLRKENSQKKEFNPKDEIKPSGFDFDKFKNLRISDLKELKDKRETDIFEESPFEEEGEAK